MTGKANLEVRPRFVNKGEIAKRLVEEYGSQPPEFVLCLGDDFTDEGKRMWTCKDEAFLTSAKTCSAHCGNPSCPRITCSPSR